MALRYYPSGDLDNASAVEDILSRYESDDIHEAPGGQDAGCTTCSTWLPRWTTAATASKTRSRRPDDDRRTSATPSAREAARAFAGRPVATCQVTIPALGGASIVA